MSQAAPLYREKPEIPDLLGETLLNHDADTIKRYYKKRRDFIKDIILQDFKLFSGAEVQEEKGIALSHHLSSAV